jgi:hypothetical protein
VSAKRRAKSEGPRAIETDVLKPVPRVDAAYLRNASQIVETCVIESLRPTVIEELVQAARTGAYEAALNVTSLCDRFEHPVCAVSAAKSLVRYLQELGICAQVVKGQTRRLGWETEVIAVEASWREVRL